MEDAHDFTAAFVVEVAFLGRPLLANRMPYRRVRGSRKSCARRLTYLRTSMELLAPT